MHAQLRALGYRTLVEYSAMRQHLGIITLLVLWSNPGLAATFVVTKEADDNGPCTPDDCALREAVLAANGLPGADVIEIPGGDYHLTLIGPPGEILSQTGDLDITDDLTIRGDELKPVIIIGDGTDRVIEIISFTGSFDISHITITGGVAQSSGGGLRASGLHFTLRDSTITGNMSSADGGGIFIAGVLRSANIVNSTIAGNSALLGRGGGIHVTAIDSSQFVDLVNTTIGSNISATGGGVSLVGGGHFSLTNLTIVDNVADVAFGDGLLADSIAANRLTISNTLIANNSCGYVSTIPVSNGHNMEGPTATCFNPIDGDRMGVPDVMLGPLSENGGPTQTHALLPGSPAIDAALGADCPDVDQRGFARPVDGDGDGVPRCDIGAFEAGAVPPSAIPTLDAVAVVVLALLMTAAGCLRLRHRRAQVSETPAPRP